MLLFLIFALFLLYIALLGTGYSQLFPEIVIPTFILIILVYMFEGALERDTEKGKALVAKYPITARKWDM